MVTVADEGAVAVARDALAAAGIPSEARPAGREHPYQAQVFATPFRILVPEARREDARAVLDVLAQELEEEVVAQSGSAASAASSPAA